MTAKQLKGTFAPDGATYVTLTDGNGTLATSGGSSSLTIGTTPISGGATTQVLFNNAGVVGSDSGLTYAGAGGPLALTVTTASAPNLISTSSANSGLFFAASGQGVGFAQLGSIKWDYNITSGGVFTLASGVGLTVSGAGAVNIPSLGLGGGGTITWATRTIVDTNSTDGAIRVKNNAGTSTFTLQVTGAAAPIKFVDAGSFTANSTTATVLGSLGPAGASTTVTKWLTIVDNGGTTRYIPCF